jgi:hypothetical protein
LCAACGFVDVVLSMVAYNEVKILDFGRAKCDKTIDARAEIKNNHQIQQRTFQG